MQPQISERLIFIREFFSVYLPLANSQGTFFWLLTPFSNDFQPSIFLAEITISLLKLFKDMTVFAQV